MPDTTSLSALRIVAVGRYRLLRVLCRIVQSAQIEAPIEVLELGFDEAVQRLHVMHQHAPIDMVVAAGSNCAYLRAHLKLPLCEIIAGDFDMLQALAQARAHSAHVALVSYHHASAVLAQFDAQFGLGVQQFSYEGEADASRCVQALQAQGIEAVVAPGLVCDLAEQLGMHSVFLYSDEAVIRGLEQAVALASQQRAARARSVFLHRILQELPDGVLALDSQDRVEAVNAAMAQLLGQPAPALLGRPLASVDARLAALPLSPEQGTAQEEVLQFGWRTLLIKRARMPVDGLSQGSLILSRDQATIQQADRRLRSARASTRPALRYQFQQLLGSSAPMQRLRQLAERCAQEEATVLITGESGTGKELLAQAIHAASARASQPFVAVNCAALSESLLESELFGYEEGAFTGARRGGKAGLFEAAHTGTLFLDEIGDVPKSLQTRLLRALQEREIMRVGATSPLRVDVRIIAATHADLDALVREKQFRADLLYRLAVLRLPIAPLRARREDILPLAEAIHARLCQRRGKPASMAALHAMLARAANYAWPGNVRELENTVERLLCYWPAVAENGQAALLDEQFPEFAAAQPLALPAHSPVLPTRQEAERRHIEQVLQACGGDRKQACAQLGISRATLWRRLREQGEAV